ncbi:hypothetical protein Plhal304r1_c041g0119181 [Plasmopara halstedii]
MEELKQKRWTNGKEAVRAIKDVAVAPEKRAIVSNREGTFRLLQCDSATIACVWHIRRARFRSKNRPGDWNGREATSITKTVLVWLSHHKSS